MRSACVSKLALRTILTPQFAASGRCIGREAWRRLERYLLMWLAAGLPDVSTLVVLGCADRCSAQVAARSETHSSGHGENASSCEERSKSEGESHVDEVEETLVVMRS